MYPETGENSIFHKKLGRMVGLNQILDFNAHKICGYNVCHIAVALIGLFYVTISIMCSIGLYYFMSDIVVFVLYLGYISNCMLSYCKIMNILFNANGVCEIINVSNFYFMSYKHYSKDVYNKWSMRSATIMKAYLMMAILIPSIWIISPFIIKDKTITMKKVDGSYLEFRMNIMNIYFTQSGEEYKNNYYKYYFAEAIFGLCIIYFSMIHDILMIIICFAFFCQLERISEAISALGRNIKCSTRNSTYFFVNFYLYFFL